MWLKIALKTHEIAPFLQTFLGEDTPKPPKQRLAASLLAACITKIPKILKLGPPLRNPAYAPASGPDDIPKSRVLIASENKLLGIILSLQ